jgi:hypothetical protein
VNAQSCRNRAKALGRFFDLLDLHPARLNLLRSESVLRGFFCMPLWGYTPQDCV